MQFRIKHKKTLIFILILAAFCGVMTQVDFLGDRLVTEAGKVVSGKLGLSLSVGGITGNPFYGYQAEKVALYEKESKVLELDRLTAKLSFVSLIKGAPALSLLEASGCDTDVETIKSLIPEKKSDKPMERLPLNKIVVSDFRLLTPYGLFETEKGVVKQNTSMSFRFGMKGKLSGKNITLYGALRREEKSWIAQGLTAGVEKSRLVLNGTLFPVPDMSVRAKEINIHEITQLFPDINSYGVRGIFSAESEIKGLKREELVSKGSGSLRDALVAGLPVSSVNFEWNYDRGIISLSVKDSQAFGSPVSGEFFLDTTKEIPEAKVKFLAENLNFTEWKKSIKVEQAKDISGFIPSFKIDVHGPLTGLYGEAEIAPSDIKYRHFEIKQLKGKMLFDGTPEGRVNFTAKHMGKDVSLSGKIAFAKGYSTDINLTELKLSLQDLAKLVPFLEKHEAKGIIGISGKLTGNAENWNITAKLNSDRMTGLKLPELEKVRTAVTFKTGEKKVVVENFSARMNKALLTAGGSFDTFREGSMNLKGKASEIKTENFRELVKFFKTADVKSVMTTDWEASGKLSGIIIKADISAPSLELYKLKTVGFTSPVVYHASEKLLEAGPAELSAYGGRITLEGNVDMSRKKSDKVLWSMKGTSDGVSAELADDYAGKETEVTGVITGVLTAKNEGKGFEWSITTNNSELSWKNKTISEMHGLIYGTAKKLQVENLRARFLSGDNIVNGSIIFPDKKTAEKGKDNSALDLTLDTTDINLYEALRKHMPRVRGFQGLVDTKVHLTGTISDPHFEGSCLFAPLRYRSFNLPHMSAEFSGNFKDINITEARAQITGLGDIKGDSRIYYSKESESWKTLTNIKGVKVGLRQFGEYLPAAVKKRIGGKADFEVHLHGDINNISGDGSFSSPSVRLLGVSLRNIKAPFYISDGYLIMEDVNAQMNGGTLSGGAAYNLPTSMWGINATAMDVDVYETIKQIKPDIAGKLTGKGNLKIRFHGNPGRMSTVRGSGALVLSKGELSGFKAIEAAKKFTGGKPLRFETVQASFNYDGGSLTLLPGSQATAPPNDPVYRFVMLDGLITDEKKLSLFAIGKVNIRALNTVLGAMNGIVQLSSDLIEGTVNKSDAIKSVLSGIVGGFAKGEFSFVSMNIGGDVTKPVFSNIKIDKIKKHQDSGKYIPKSGSDPDDDDSFSKEDKKFKLKFEIPLGPGAKHSPSGVAGDIVEQTLESLINNLNIGD